MKKNNLIGKIVLIAVFAATMPLIEASAFRVLAGAAQFALNRKRLALGATGTVFGAAAVSQAQKDSENQEQSKGIKSVIIKFPLYLDQRGAGNFSSSIYSDKYNEDRHFSLYQNTTIKDVTLGWLFDKLINIKKLSNLSGNYSFGVKAISKTAETQFDSSATNQNLRAHSETFLGAYAWPTLNFCLQDKNQPNGRCIFGHSVRGIPSEDGTTVRLQAKVTQEHHNGLIVNSVWDVERFTPKGCEQDYLKKLANKETTESTKKAYIEKCLKTSTKRVIPKESRVID